MTKPFLGFCVSVLITAVLFGPVVANACTCVESYAPWIAEFSGADAVFAGKVRAVIPVKPSRDENFVGDRIVTFEIAKAYKGVPSSTRLISLYSDYARTSCSFGVDGRRGPAKGETWIVLANSTGTPQMSFGGSCNASRRTRSKSDLLSIEKEAFKFQQQQGIVGSVKLNYTALAKDVEISLAGEGVNETAKVDVDGYYWFPLERPGRYSVTATIPFHTTLIDAVHFPQSFDQSGSQTRFSYTVDLKVGEYHYNEVNVNEHARIPNSIDGSHEYLYRAGANRGSVFGVNLNSFGGLAPIRCSTK